jgi:hypothetical protein
MKIEDVKTLDSPQERILYWMQERESIRLKKKAKKIWPWTDDEILQTYRFCNVRRINDKVSMWLYRNWYKPNKNHPNMVVACAIARYVNKPDSLKEIGFPLTWKPKLIKKILRARRDRGCKVFNGAYIIRGNDGLDKIASVVDAYCSPLKKQPLEHWVDTKSMRKTWENLNQCYGFGSFMAGQVTADLRWAVDHKWKDRHTWAPLGPGSLRGMNRLLERDIKTHMKQEEFDVLLMKLRKTCLKFLPSKLTKNLEAIDYQNCLCEFDKYERTLWENRRPKQLYRR